MSPSYRDKLLSFRFPLLFLGCMIVLMAGYYALPVSFVENSFVRFFAVVPGSFFIDLITPDTEVSANGTRIVSNIAKLNVLKGCEGTEVLLILYSAIIATLRPLKFSIIGIVIGTLIIFVLNQFRIVALFFIAAYHRSTFEIVHGLLAPLIIIAITGLFFMLWHKRSLASS